jgi:hypothetical protein
MYLPLPAPAIFEAQDNSAAAGYLTLASSVSFPTAGRVLIVTAAPAG